MFDQIVFGEKLKNHRKALALTQEEVAEKMGVSGQAVSKWELGECLPDCYNLKLLGDIYDVSLDILLDTQKACDITSVTNKIKQLATEFVWNKFGNDKPDIIHLELGDDLWEMWKAIYFVEIGNKELQDREMKHANNHILGDYGAKVWDDKGFACVVKSDIKNHLDNVSENELLLLQKLVSKDYFNVLKNIDCHYPISKETLLEKSSLDEVSLNEIVIYLTENYIIEYFNNHMSIKKGYKLTANRGIIAYVILSIAYLLTQSGQSLTEYLPS